MRAYTRLRQRVCDSVRGTPGCRHRLDRLKWLVKLFSISFTTSSVQQGTRQSSSWYPGSQENTGSRGDDGRGRNDHSSIGEASNEHIHTGTKTDPPTNPQPIETQPKGHLRRDQASIFYEIPHELPNGNRYKNPLVAQKSSWKMSLDSP